MLLIPKQKFMKKNDTHSFLVAILFCLFLPALIFGQKKNYISIEGGRFYGGAENDIKSQMVSSGFGDRVTYNLDDLNTLLALIIPFWDASSVLNCKLV